MGPVLDPRGFDQTNVDALPHLLFGSTTEQEMWEKGKRLGKWVSKD
ncbi:hypothetical protein [Ktedonobacter racemifer]|uniref:Uncharacterized protein n=1 Tax=Ktedonobacter racemifer DSM 44963 TaxID=485913 RepID=D6U8C3_KTERA|nr:hypothetical protein [Ktedonobacter racemifer]EFH80134.1 hypothetical protein Krac_0688 [Ktedonobacter racemifer DSM 44963]